MRVAIPECDNRHEEKRQEGEEEEHHKNAIGNLTSFHRFSITQKENHVKLQGHHIIILALIVIAGYFLYKKMRG